MACWDSNYVKYVIEEKMKIGDKISPSISKIFSGVEVSDKKSMIKFVETIFATTNLTNEDKLFIGSFQLITPDKTDFDCLELPGYKITLHLC